MENTKTVYKGTGILNILAIVFIVLKLIGVGQVATWSWWWVLSPIWIPWAFIFLILIVVVIIAAIVED